MDRPRYINADLRRLPTFGLMAGFAPPDDFVSNGATGAPDVVFGRDVRPAAHFHDYAYTLRGTEWTRYCDDRNFLVNLRMCGLAGRLGWVAWMYYFRVRFWGHHFYQYGPESEPIRNWRFYLSLLFARYFTP